MFKLCLYAATVLFVLSGCASNRYKARQEQRDKAASSSGLYCEFVSGDEFTDVDVEVNLRMSKKCDSEKNFSITGYKNASDNHGVVYCCGHSKLTTAKASVKNTKNTESKTESGKVESLKNEKPEDTEPAASGASNGLE